MEKYMDMHQTISEVLTLLDVLRSETKHTLEIYEHASSSTDLVFIGKIEERYKEFLSDLAGFTEDAFKDYNRLGQQVSHQYQNKKMIYA